MAGGRGRRQVLYGTGNFRNAQEAAGKGHIYRDGMHRIFMDNEAQGLLGKAAGKL